MPVVPPVWFFTRRRPGQAEGLVEAFANIYTNFIECIKMRAEGKKPHRDFPGIEEGIRGMKFIDAVIESGEKNASWTKIEK